MSEQDTQTPEVTLEEDLSPEELTALQENEDFILNFSEEDANDPDKVEKLNSLLKDAKSTIHQKRHYRDKVAELQKGQDPANNPGEKKPEKDPEEKPQGTPTEAEDGVDPYKKLEFRQDHPELSKEVVKEILDYAGVKKISPEEALKLPLIQTLIENDKTRDDVEDASVAPGSKPGAGKGSKDWSNASQAEIEAERNRIMQQGH